MSDEPIAALPITLEAPALAGEVTPPAKPKRPKSKRLKDTALWAAMTPELWDLSRVLPSALNARIHTAKQVKAIAESMKQFGFTIPILVDEMRKDGKLKEGQLVCFLGLGAGLNWGAALMRL